MNRLAIEIIFVVAALVGVAVFQLYQTGKVRAQITQPIHERFHREDAAEMMRALCTMNTGIVCPDPYKSPRYLEMVRPGGHQQPDEVAP